MPPEPFQPPSVFDASYDVIEAIQGLVEDQVALQMARVQQTATHSALAFGFAFAAAGSLGLAGVWFAAALTLALATQMPGWAAVAIMGAVLVLFSIAMAAIAYRVAPLPTDPEDLMEDEDSHD